MSRRVFVCVSGGVVVEVIPVTPTMLQGNLLDYRSYFRLFLGRMPLLERAVEAPAADRNQLAHALDTQAA